MLCCPKKSKSKEMKKMLLVCCLVAGMASAALAQLSIPGSAGSTVNTLQKAQALQKQLNLSDSQTQQVAGIYADASQQYSQIKAKDTGNSQQLSKDKQSLANTVFSKIKGLLTPAQLTKYEAYLKKNGASILSHL